MTTIEYFDTPETVLPRELAYGVLHVADAPSVGHQRVVRDLLLALDPFVRERQLGEVLPAPLDVVLDFDRALVVQPDLIFVARGREHLVTDHLVGAPDLAVEVLSPQPRVGQLETRIGWFARYGVRECWLVHLTRREISVLDMGDGAVKRQAVFTGANRLRSAVLPGVPLAPGDLLSGYRSDEPSS